jgi:hypothetical protein
MKLNPTHLPIVILIQKMLQYTIVFLGTLRRWRHSKLSVWYSVASYQQTYLFIYIYNTCHTWSKWTWNNNMILYHQHKKKDILTPWYRMKGDYIQGRKDLCCDRIHRELAFLCISKWMVIFSYVDDTISCCCFMVKILNLRLVVKILILTLLSGEIS